MGKAFFFAGSWLDARRENKPKYLKEEDFEKGRQKVDNSAWSSLLKPERITQGELQSLTSVVSYEHYAS